MIFHFSMITGKFYFSSVAENSPPVHFHYNKVILFQEGPMVTQWTRQKAQWLSQRGLSWPWTALTRLLIWHPIFSGISSISTKLLNSSWRARCQTRSQRVKAFRPLLFRVTGPSTCRNGQCKHQTRLCTTVLWVTQWHRAAGELSTNPECRWGSGCGQPCKGVLFLSPVCYARGIVKALPGLLLRAKDLWILGLPYREESGAGKCRKEPKSFSPEMPVFSPSTSPQIESLKVKLTLQWQFRFHMLKYFTMC